MRVANSGSVAASVHQWEVAMPIALGLLGSLVIGFSDFFARYVARRNHAATTAATGLVFASIAAVIVASLGPGRLLGSDYLLGCVSGLASACALGLLYRGLAVSSVAVVSPIVAVMLGAVPMFWELVTGTVPSAGVLVGVAVVPYRFSGHHIRPGPRQANQNWRHFGVLVWAFVRYRDAVYGTDQCRRRTLACSCPTQHCLHHPGAVLHRQRTPTICTRLRVTFLGRSGSAWVNRCAVLHRWFSTRFSDCCRDRRVFVPHTNGVAGGDLRRRFPAVVANTGYWSCCRRYWSDRERLIGFTKQSCLLRGMA